MNRIFKLNIMFIDSKTDKFYCGVHNYKAEKTIFIYWVNKRHFQPIGTITSDNEINLMFDTKSKIVRNILKKYKMNCKKKLRDIIF